MEKRQAGAGIEVTPEMIEAGIDLLVSYDPRFESEEDFVRRFLTDISPKAGNTDLNPKRLLDGLGPSSRVCLNLHAPRSRLARPISGVPPAGDAS